MSRCVVWSLLGSIVAAALIALVGCSHYLVGERESWRHDAEVACMNSAAGQESPTRVRISAIEGPGICGASFPLRVSALGESAALGYDDEPPRPPGTIPDGMLPRWPVVQSNASPPPSPYGAPPQYGPPHAVPSRSVSTPSPALSPAQPVASMPPPGAPISLYPPGVAAPEEDDEVDFQPAPPQPYNPAPAARPAAPAARYSPQSYPPNDQAPTYPPRGQAAPAPADDAYIPLGPPRAPVTASVGPVEVKPPATLSCPIVSALDRWIMAAVQPAALRWFRQPVVEIKQISAYSCRGMNGDPNAHISEHAFGNALDIAEFTLADGHRISVQYGWRGTPEEQGFLHDVQLAACDQFTTVLAPGANVYHYNHIHVDLMRRSSGRHICQPAAIPGEVVAERARARYAAQHPGEPVVTGSIKNKGYPRALGYSADEEDRLPLAVPGAD
jgi:Extensin-like protein C-terminus